MNQFRIRKRATQTSLPELPINFRSTTTSNMGYYWHSLSSICSNHTAQTRLLGPSGQGHQYGSMQESMRSRPPNLNVGAQPVSGSAGQQYAGFMHRSVRSSGPNLSMGARRHDPIFPNTLPRPFGQQYRSVQEHSVRFAAPQLNMGAQPINPTSSNDFTGPVRQQYGSMHESVRFPGPSLNTRRRPLEPAALNHTSHPGAFGQQYGSLHELMRPTHPISNMGAPTLDSKISSYAATGGHQYGYMPELSRPPASNLNMGGHPSDPMYWNNMGYTPTDYSGRRPINFRPSGSISNGALEQFWNKTMPTNFSGHQWNPMGEVRPNQLFHGQQYFPKPELPLPTYRHGASNQLNTGRLGLGQNAPPQYSIDTPTRQYIKCGTTVFPMHNSDCSQVRTHTLTHCVRFFWSPRN